MYSIDEKFLQKIETLDLMLKNSNFGSYGGNHKSKLFGSSSEFADYRDYLAGDEMTKIDWNAYQRFNKLYLKLYLDERGEDDIESLWVTGKKEKREVGYQTLYEWFVYMANLLHDLTGENIPFNAHSLRHSSLENLSNGTHYLLKELGVEKLELEQLKVYAHHSDISTTSSYLKDNSNDLLENTFGIKITN